MTPERKAQLLKSWALEEGFDLAGVARAEGSEQGEALFAWLERGDQAGMGWMGNGVERRLDPGRVLAGARSVLCVGLRYHPLAGEDGGAEDSVEGDLWPRVARYARGQDYHEVMGRGLRRLEKRVAEAFPGAGTRRYVDTGPLLERELAARAGLGVQGKNTNLLSREAGSWFLLGELLLTLDLAPDPPVADLCGRCTRCLDLCPTGALPEPYRLDANRCISYWTIEHRGDLPSETREMLGDWVFGCDVCQEVCPWNLRGEHRDEREPADHPELRLPAERGELDLAGLLLLGHDDYVQRFRGSPMKRARQEGLQRNAAVAMGNRRDPGYVAPLAQALAEGASVVRRHAAWALGRIETREAREALEEALRGEADDSVKHEISAALGEGESSRSNEPESRGGDRR
ncbi:MAG TPA: tRNA epoxyqueuosine(34) reductase QueG [Thermoanaerobaculia bacterium]|nr:tRNA epoxyqueuosine(34) reductase QueG [Thermoanaerobaculia bacterium]